MGKVQKKMDISILEAVDNLTMMADIDTTELTKNPKLLLEHLREKAKWLTYESKKLTDEKIKSTFSSIHHYLELLGKKAIQEEQKVHYQRGMIAMMGLTHDAIEKADLLKKSIFSKEQSLSIKEYEEVKNLNKFFKEFSEHDLDKSLVSDELDLKGALYAKNPKELIKDFNVLKNDTDYELLFIRRDDGQPFFSQEVLTHARYICEFDMMFLDFVEENPLRMVKIVQDEEACIVADEIYQKIQTSAKVFLKAFKARQEDTLSQLLYSAIVALTAAKNPQNLLRSKRHKNCLEYFHDFYYFLHQICGHQLIDHLEDDEYHQKCQAVIKELTSWFFLHPMEHDLAIETINQLIQKGQLKPIKRHSIWNFFLLSYEKLDSELKKSPSGPIFKLIEQYESGEFEEGFNSIGQGNTPSKILDFVMNDKTRSLLYLPSPTLQEESAKAKPIEEFSAFLHLNPTKSLLLFNLQDKQYVSKARVDAIEKLSSTYSNLHVVSLPKDNHFYHQIEEYFDLEEASSFLKALYDQVQGAPVSGFGFPKKLKIEKLKEFSQKIIPWIHEKFFSKNKILTRKNRLDFIELFYGLLAIKVMEMLDCDYLSFTCKDAIDVGSLANLQFYALLKYFIDPNAPLTELDQRALIKIALVPAFIQRTRMPSYKRLERMLSFLSVFEAATSFSEADKEALLKFFPKSHFKEMRWVEDAA